MKNELGQWDQNESSVMESSVNKDCFIDLQKAEKFQLKLVIPPCTSRILDDESRSLSDYKISSDTLLVLEND